MTEEEWHRFVWGCDPQIATIGELPRDLCKAIGSGSPIIRMHHYYALKCAHKHGLDTGQMLMLPITLAMGRCIQDRPRNLTFFHFDPHIYGSWFHASLKTDKNGNEIWLMTFHESDNAEVKRKCKKAKLVRPEKE